MNPFLKACWLGAVSAVLLGCASQPHVDKMASDVTSGGMAKGMPGTSAPGLPADLDEAVRQGQAQRAAGDLAAAARTLSQLVLVAPDDPRVVGEYGKTLVAQGRSDDALAFLERAIVLKPDWTLYSAQGIAYDQKGNYAAAQSAYDRALALKPGEPSVLSNNALSHMQSGDLEGAEKLLMQAAQNGQSSPKVASNLALLRSLKSATRQPPAAPASLPAPAPNANPVPVLDPATQAPPAAMPIPPLAVPPAKTSALLPNETVERIELPPPAPETSTTGATQSAAAPVTAALPGIERLKSDPGVLMQAVPHDPLAGPVRPNTQAAKTGSKTPGASDGLAGAAGLRPALSDWDWRLPAGARH